MGILENFEDLGKMALLSVIDKMSAIQYVRYWEVSL